MKQMMWVIKVLYLHMYTRNCERINNFKEEIYGENSHK